MIEIDGLFFNNLIEGLQLNNIAEAIDFTETNDLYLMLDVNGNPACSKKPIVKTVYYFE